MKKSSLLPIVLLIAAIGTGLYAGKLTTDHLKSIQDPIERGLAHISLAISINSIVLIIRSK